MRGEWIIYLSLVAVFATTLYQPLAGSLLSIKQVNVPSGETNLTLV